jgi:heme exporter protein B
MLLSIDQVWQQDYDNGLMTQWYLLQKPIVTITQAKVLVHWLFSLVATLLIMPILTVAYGLHFYQSLILFTAVSAGSLMIAYLTALAAAFSLSMQQKGVMMALILLPLVLPVMIWGSGVVSLASQPINVNPYLALLLAGSIGSVMLLPWPIALVIKMQISECE